MQDLLDSLGKRLESLWKTRDVRAERHSRSYQCRCGNRIFFDNTQCLLCGSPLGLLPDTGAVVALDPGLSPGTWCVAGRKELLKCCANRDSQAACNWMIFAHNPRIYCIACRLNRTIPRLDDADNVRYWIKIEAAKRRIVSQMIALGLPVGSRIDDDPEHGLMFDFLRSEPGGPRVMTGHGGGLITINVEEADDAKREQIKYELREPYRTLLGHFRHEIGHYYWYRIVWSTPGWLEPCRELFGDERASYTKAIERHYKVGPPPDWADSFITSYAAMHPWEDWAETWAHYLHIVDSLGTAMGFGIDIDNLEGEVQPFTLDALYAPDDPGAARFLKLLNAWVGMTMILNELARSMGQPDFYPFVMSKPVVAKLQFVQMIVLAACASPDL